MTNENVMADVQHGANIVNALTAYERSGIKMTAKCGSIEITVKDHGKSDDERVHRICDSGVTMHRERKTSYSEQGRILEEENCDCNADCVDGFCKSWERNCE